MAINNFNKYLIKRLLGYVFAGKIFSLVRKIYLQLFDLNKINLDKLSVDHNLSLNDLFNKFGSENGSYDTKKTYFYHRSSKEFLKKFPDYEKWIIRSEEEDKAFKHQSGVNYTSIFEKYLESYKDKKTNFLQIGTRGGHTIAGLYYYLKKMNFYSISFKDRNKFIFFSKRIFFKTVNIRDPRQVKKFLSLNNLFDIILDDEFHEQDSIVLNFKNFINYCNDVYIIKGFESDDKLLIALQKYNSERNTKMYYPSNNYTTREVFNFIKKKEFFYHNILSEKFLKNLYNSDYEIDIYDSDHPAGGLIIFKKK